MKFNYSDIIKNQPTLNLGMIGHVASGKSTLTRQITGTKTQKFSSEKERNITMICLYGHYSHFFVVGRFLSHLSLQIKVVCKCTVDLAL